MNANEKKTLRTEIVDPVRDKNMKSYLSKRFVLLNFSDRRQRTSCQIQI